MYLIFCQKCFDIFKLIDSCQWCSCGSCGGATALDSYLHWGGEHRILHVSEKTIRDLVLAPERYSGFVMEVLVVPTVKSEELPSLDPLKK